MLTFAVAVSPFYAFEQSDTFGRLVVLVLFLCSIIAWSIIIEKWLALRRVRRQLHRFLSEFSAAPSPLDVFAGLDSFDGPVRNIAHEALAAVARLEEMSPATLVRDWYAGSFRSRLSEQDLDHVRALVERAVDTEVARLEQRLGLLGSIVSASPFLGLLGTVWGVMIAFCGMAAHGKADIDAIAPGVSGALLTTVVGLFVAIPALIGFNVLSGVVRQLTVKLDNFADTFLSLLKSRLSNMDIRAD